jgi:hypothetical protein
MGNCEVVGRKIGGTGVAVDERSVRVVENLVVAVVFHHDYEDVIKMWNSFGNGALLSPRRTRQCGQYSKKCHLLFHVSTLSFLKRGGSHCKLPLE